MNFTECFQTHNSILMEGALGERLKREYGIVFDRYIDMGALVYTEEGRTALSSLWEEYAAIANRYHLPFLATTTTRRTNQERMANTDYSDSIIWDNVAFLRKVQSKQSAQMYVGGLMGCRGDAYTGVGALGTEEAKVFHRWEATRFAEAGVDFLYAALIPTLGEAVGIALTIEEQQIPYIISFTIREDGCLVDGTLLADAIQTVDKAVTFRPVCYMANCVHPRILKTALKHPGNQNAMVRERFLGIQANTSMLSFEELDGSAQLHTTDPVSLAEDMLALRDWVPLKIFGGCCGTTGEHMKEIAKRIHRIK